MAEKCELCFQEITESTVRDHIINQHADHGESVSAAYPDLYQELFTEDDELVREENPQAEVEEVDGEGETYKSQEKKTSHGETSSSPSSQSVSQQNIAEQTAETDERPGGGITERSESGVEDGGTKARSSSPGREMTGAIGDKWFIIGIGGAGNHITDAVLMRRATLHEQNSSLGIVWDEGLADYGCLNTNIAELKQTYYAQEDRGFQEEQLITNCMIGYRHHNYSGAGRNWRVGRELMQKDFEGERNAIRDRLDLNPRDIEASQALMLVHSVTKGTGCGATPVLAENLRKLTEEETSLDVEQIVSKPILSSVVLPSVDKFGSSEMIRGLVGMAYLSQSVDAIIPFENSNLDDPPSSLAVDINPELLERYNPPQHTDKNRLLVTFLEAFTMSSIPQSVDTANTARINGDVFDVPDSYRPVQRKYPAEHNLSYTPAVMMAPVIGKTTANSFDYERLDTLARSTLLQNQLVDFDLQTAWGGTFMIYGPAEKMERLSTHLDEDRMQNEVLSGEDFFDRGNFEGPGSVDIYVNQLVVPHVEDVYMWGLVWNPRFPTLKQMFEHGREYVEQSESKEARELREMWDDIEPLFECLGRENMG